MSKLERIFVIRPAFDKRSEDPKKDYGIHGAEMLFVLKGEEGAVQFVLYTNWQLPHVQRETDARILAKAQGIEPRAHITRITGAAASDPGQVGKMIESVEKALGRVPGVLDQIDLNVAYHPIPADVGYHSPKPMYEDQKPIGSQKVNMGNMQKLMDQLKNKDDKNPVDIPPVMEETGTFTPCEWLDGKPCYYDGSGLYAQEFYDLLISEGSEAVWNKLEGYYNETFRAKVSKEG